MITAGRGARPRFPPGRRQSLPNHPAPGSKPCATCHAPCCRLGCGRPRRTAGRPWVSRPIRRVWWRVAANASGSLKYTDHATNATAARTSANSSGVSGTPSQQQNCRRQGAPCRHAPGRYHCHHLGSQKSAWFMAACPYNCCSTISIDTTIKPNGTTSLQ
jgi:hypothetical protein